MVHEQSFYSDNLACMIKLLRLKLVVQAPRFEEFVEAWSISDFDPGALSKLGRII